MIKVQALCSAYTRDTGAYLYAAIAEAFAEGREVHLDFEGCRVASVGFLDEAIARFVADTGLNPLDRITLHGMTGPDRVVLDSLVRKRLGYI